MQDPLSKKQLEYVIHSTKKWNLAHGSVRAGKTVGKVFRFMQAAYTCPDSKIYIVGHTFDTAHRNIIRLIMESPQLAVFRPFCTWSGKKLHFHDKTITVLGAKDEGAIGQFQGDTWSLACCDEMTLYPESIIDMIDTRLSNAWSMGFGSMNPTYPHHKVKKWIDKASEGDPNYYALHFTLDDNPYLEQSYKERIKNSLSGLFYKRNYLGLWCLAEGAIFDFWDRDIYMQKKIPASANYFIAGIDYGMENPTACIVVGVHTGVQNQTGKTLWAENEYYWDRKVKGRQKLVGELAQDIQEFLDPYGVRAIYIDPSAAALRAELSRRGIHCVDAENDVEAGIQIITSMIREGQCQVMYNCTNLIREIEGYSWDPKAAERGDDKPIKKDDHIIDALRYCLASHKVATYQPYKEPPGGGGFGGNRYQPTRRSI